MTAPLAAAGAAGAGESGLLRRKFGPLPLWGWMLIVAGAALAYRHFAGGGSSSTDTTDQTSSLPSDVQPDLIIQNYIEGTPAATPPVGGGASSPPVSAPTAPAGGGTTKTPPKKTVPKAGGSGGTKVTNTTVPVGKWPAKDSTISGIAELHGFGSDWQKIWNFSGNSALRNRRKEPDKIQPGDKVALPPK